MEASVTADDILALVVERAAAVLALEPADVSPDARFDDDLHADSLDLVEVIEGVERALRKRGVEVTLADAELVTLRTVADAADRIAAHAAGRADDPPAAAAPEAGPAGDRPRP